MRKAICLISFVLMVAGCSTSNGEGETIVFNCSENSTFSAIGDVFSGGRFLVPGGGEDGEMMFSMPEQVAYKDGRLYLSDGRFGKIVVYKDDGTPEMCLSRKGRGPQEYLQVSYFDIDRTGSIWVMDGQGNRLIQYSPEGSFLRRYDLEYEINYFKCLDSGNFLFGLAPWDDSGYKDKKVLLVDGNLNVISSFIDATEYTDPNFEFPAQGFVSTGSGIFYHSPVDDYIYRLTPDGELEKSYYLDFGSQAFPEEMRKDIESNYEELENYRTLVNMVYIDDGKVIGSIWDGGMATDFIIDRRSDILYLRDEAYGSLHLVGIYGDSAIFYIPAGYPGDIPYMPESVKAEYDSGKDVFLLLDVNSIF